MPIVEVCRLEFSTDISVASRNFLQRLGKDGAALREPLKLLAGLKESSRFSERAKTFSD